MVLSLFSYSYDLLLPEWRFLVFYIRSFLIVLHPVWFVVGIIYKSKNFPLISLHAIGSCDTMGNVSLRPERRR